MNPTLLEPLTNQQYLHVLKHLDGYDTEKSNSPELMATLGKYFSYAWTDLSIVQTMVDLPWFDYDNNIIPLASQWWTLVNPEAYEYENINSHAIPYRNALLHSNFGRATALMYAWILDEHPSRVNIKRQLQAWSQCNLPQSDVFKNIYQESYLAWILHQWGQSLEKALEARSWLTMLKTLNANTRDTSQLKKLYDPLAATPSSELPNLPDLYTSDGVEYQ